MGVIRADGLTPRLRLMEVRGKTPAFPRQALPVGGGLLLRRPGTEHEPLDSDSGDIGV